MVIMLISCLVRLMVDVFSELVWILLRLEVFGMLVCGVFDLKVFIYRLLFFDFSFWVLLNVVSVIWFSGLLLLLE